MEGIIYYNVGLKCLVRLAVSLSTLVRYCDKQVTILADDSSMEQCIKIGKFFGANVIEADFDDDRDKNWVLLNKCRLHEMTPYERTIFIDSDTIILKDFSDAFKYLDKCEFFVTQMSNWLTAGKKYTKRINAWKKVIPEDILNKTYDQPKAVNTGFYGWRHAAMIFDGWYKTARMNRYSFIPDEIACQILLPHFNHKVISNEYNTSCKHDVITRDTRTVHFHGRKHCRIENGEYVNNSKLWYEKFDKIKNMDFVKDNIEHDRMLRKNIDKHA